LLKRFLATATAFDVVGWGKVKNEGILAGREACPGVEAIAHCHR